ncbi:thioredoxin-like protein [Xylaria bambusicola]|uniref:thioredoxin-like protein n=1 Tax=Xylaria bambusicola TaxID=326684 RepID=UPI002008B0C8|nr:thioredoxin-like protein [Xylaria bambusicola]KAI0523651.1 thioredoxin-like protein [Xylaria bambusicola]
MSFRAATHLCHLSTLSTLSTLPLRRSAFAAFASPRLLPLRQFHSTPPNMTVHNIATKADFDEAIKANKIVILDAFATWCGPCKAIAPLVAKLSNEERFQDVYFAKIDVDELPELSQELGITAMPTFMGFKNGEPAGKVMGANPPAIEKLVVDLQE